MKILYYTNKDIADWDTIPKILKENGDDVFTYTKKLTVDIVKQKKINFIVSDRARFLIEKDILDLLPKKIINLHPSYLPWNRGYHPNLWSIYNNSPHGVSIHYIDEGIDTGDILAQIRLNYCQNETLKDSYNRCRYFMVKLFEMFWPLIRNDSIKPIIQKKNDGDLHFKKDFKKIEHLLTNGWDTKIKIFKKLLK